MTRLTEATETFAWAREIDWTESSPHLRAAEKMVKEKKGRRFATVNTEVTINDGGPIPVVYSMMENADSGWKVYNLTVGDLNMVINYRNVIQSSIHSEGLDGTIASMKENNDRNYNPG